MKNLIMVVLAVTLVTTAYTQNISSDKVPAPVSSAFKSKFPKAESVKWEMENGKDFEASFKISGSEQSVVFDASGSWIETETEIKTSALPQTVSSSIAKQFSGYKIKESEKVEKQTGTFYEVELSKDKSILEVTFSIKGDVVEKKTKEKNDKEDKD